MSRGHRQESLHSNESKEGDYLSTHNLHCSKHWIVDGASGLSWWGGGAMYDVHIPVSQLASVVVSQAKFESKEH